MVTKEMVERYEAIRASGLWNMLSREALEQFESYGYSKDEYMDIINNYGEYMKKFGVERRA